MEITYQKSDNMLQKLNYGMMKVIEQSSEIKWFGVGLYFFITITLYVLLKKDPSKPWVLLMCIFSLLVGALEKYILPEDQLVSRLSDDYKDLKITFLSTPTIGVRSVSKVLSDPQFYVDSMSMTIVVMLENMICWGMLSITTDQIYLSKTRNLFSVVIANMVSILTGTLGISFVYARSYLNEKAGAVSRLACILNGLVCLLVGFVFFNLFSYMPTVALEAILMGLELKVLRVGELIYTFENDFKLFLTSVTVLFAMFFTAPSNAIFIGLFIYLAFFAR